MSSMKKFFLTLVILILAGVGLVTVGKIAIDKLDLKGFTKGVEKDIDNAVKDVSKDIEDIGDDVKDISKESYKDAVKSVKDVVNDVEKH